VGAEPLLVEVTRGDVVESVHAVDAVVVQEGAGLLEAGAGGDRTAFMRSSAKPFQALPTVRTRPDLSDEEVAIACASHLARPEQLAAVRSLLARAPAAEGELECGPEPTPIEHNCSGKHAGMLALCRAEGWPGAGYRLAGHPVQHACLQELASAAEVDAGTVPTAIDGCGVLTFALTLERMAAAFARLRELEGGDRVVRAMQAYPDHIRGPLAADSMLMRHAPGWTAKGGAEGLLCAAGPDRLGLALKVVDGDTRAARPALRELLRRLGTDVPELAPVPVRNSRDEVVGELRTRL
jgi:L-asparaginase II